MCDEYAGPVKMYQQYGIEQLRLVITLSPFFKWCTKDIKLNNNVVCRSIPIVDCFPPILDEILLANRFIKKFRDSGDSVLGTHLFSHLCPC